MIVGCLGDSITAGSPLWDPDPAVRARDRDARRAQPVAVVGVRSRRRSLEFRNHGVLRRAHRPDRRAPRRRRRRRRRARRPGRDQRRRAAAAGRGGRAATSPAWSSARAGSGSRVALADVLPWTNGDEPRARTTSTRSTSSCARRSTSTCRSSRSTTRSPIRAAAPHARRSDRRRRPSVGRGPSPARRARLQRLLELEDVAVVRALDRRVERQLVRPVDDDEPPRARRRERRRPPRPR